MNIDDLTIAQARDLHAFLSAAFGGGTQSSTSGMATPLPFKICDAILIRTVTMIQLGRVKAISPEFFILEDGGWVADTGRFGEMLAKGSIAEFERVPSWFMVGRGAIVDVYPWVHEIPKATK